MKKIRDWFYPMMNLLTGYFSSKDILLQPVKIKDSISIDEKLVLSFTLRQEAIEDKKYRQSRRY